MWACHRVKDDSSILLILEGETQRIIAKCLCDNEVEAAYIPQACAMFDLFDEFTLFDSIDLFAYIAYIQQQLHSHQLHHQ